MPFGSVEGVVWMCVMLPFEPSLYTSMWLGPPMMNGSITYR